MLLIAFFYYKNEQRLYTDLTKSNLQNIVSKISNEVIFSHMRGTHFDKSKYLNNQSYEISFYDAHQQKLFGTFDEPIDFSKRILVNKHNFILIDNSTVGHLGIDYIVIKDNMLWQKLESLQNTIILFFLLLYGVICMIGFYLAKLFLKPIKDERERVNNFIKDTTHELNTPISALLMSTESSTLNDKQIERIRLSANRISEVYKDLTYIFLSQDEEKKKIERLCIDSLIKEQLNYFEPLAMKKKITILTQLESFFYTMDKDDFIRLFNNLISNAIKYNHINGTIKIVLKNSELLIEDNGMGIAQKSIPDIFKRYVRATREQGGFGIGLNIVEHICEAYHITIDVQSQLNQGSSFRLRF